MNSYDHMKDLVKMCVHELVSLIYVEDQRGHDSTGIVLPGALVLACDMTEKERSSYLARMYLENDIEGRIKMYAELEFNNWRRYFE